MQSHLDFQAAENRGNGMAAAEARHAARRQFGNPALLAEDSRDVWAWTALERLARDCRFALRLLLRNPGFSAAAVLTLALGIGANTAVYSLIDALLLRPPSVKSADRLVSLADRTPARAGRAISYPNFIDWREQNQVFERMAAYRVTSLVIADEMGADRIPGMDVSSGFFDLLGVQPELGRAFLRKTICRAPVRWPSSVTSSGSGASREHRQSWAVWCACAVMAPPRLWAWPRPDSALALNPICMSRSHRTHGNRGAVPTRSMP